VPDPEPDSVFVLTAYERTGKPLAAYKRAGACGAGHDREAQEGQLSSRSSVYSLMRKPNTTRRHVTTQTRRSLFVELMRGLAAIKDRREGRITLRTHRVEPLAVPSVRPHC